MVPTFVLFKGLGPVMCVCVCVNSYFYSGMKHNIYKKWCKDIHNDTKKNTALLNFLHQRILKKCITVSTRILSSTTVFNIANNTKWCFSNIRMISEGSCDPEYWVMAANNLALNLTGHTFYIFLYVLYWLTQFTTRVERLINELKYWLMS